MKCLTALILVTLLGGCHGSTVSVDLAGSAVDLSGADLSTTPGANHVTGSVSSATFDTVSVAYWIGAADSCSGGTCTTTVVYLFSKPVQCNELDSPGWDGRITDGTLFLEMSMHGTSPATYAVSGQPVPAPGEASVNFTRSSTSGTPAETVGRGGQVVLADIQPQAKVKGDFMLNFVGSDALAGSYEATFCPVGHEP